MSERGMLFSGPMVLALLDEIKTQTRRPVKAAQPKCPYGTPGDTIWVRETWRYFDWTEDGMPWIQYRADQSSLICDPPEEWVDQLNDIWADLSRDDNYSRESAARDKYWRPSIFLPRWASRIKRTIAAVRVEHLGDISNEDAIAEGLREFSNGWGIIESCGAVARAVVLGPTPRKAFEGLWARVHGKGAWKRDSESLVWVLTLEGK